MNIWCKLNKSWKLSYSATSVTFWVESPICRGLKIIFEVLANIWLLRACTQTQLVRGIIYANPLFSHHIYITYTLTTGQNSPREMCLEEPITEYTITGTKEVYNPYTGSIVARRAYAKPDDSRGKGNMHVLHGKDTLKWEHHTMENTGLEFHCKLCDEGKVKGDFRGKHAARSSKVLRSKLWL